MEKRIKLEGIVGSLSEGQFEIITRDVQRLLERDSFPRLEGMEDYKLDIREVIVRKISEEIEYVVLELGRHKNGKGAIKLAGVIGENRFTHETASQVQNPESYSKGFQDGRHGRECSPDSQDYVNGYKKGREVTRAYGSPPKEQPSPELI